MRSWCRLGLSSSEWVCGWSIGMRDARNRYRDERPKDTDRDKSSAQIPRIGKPERRIERHPTRSCANEGHNSGCKAEWELKPTVPVPEPTRPVRFDHDHN